MEPSKIYFTDLRARPGTNLLIKKLDVHIIPDIGMFAGFDPVALDQACADTCNRMPVIGGSLLDENMHSAGFHDRHEHFANTTDGAAWESCLEHAEKIGLGTRRYELIRI